MKMNHDPSTCELCLAGRKDICLIREKSISDFQSMTNRTGNFKDFDTLKNERIEYELKLSNKEKRSPL